MKQVKRYQALITVLAVVVIMFSGIVGFGAEPQIPLVFGCLVASLVAMWAGYTWEEILEGMIKGITNSLEAIIIMLLIGMLIGSWIACGTVPALIYYGLKIVSPPIFLPATMVICAIISFAIGAWGTVGTIGLAFMGIGVALGIPAPLVAGVVVSGSYLGDVISPLSDASNLTAAVVHDGVFAIVKKVMGVSIVTAVLVTVIYAVIGRQYAGIPASEVAASINPLMESISGQFWISPLTVLPLAIMIFCILIKMPAIPAMLIGSIAGMVEAILMQGAGIGDVLEYAYSGYISHSGNEMIDNLLTAGGMTQMLNSISIIVIAMAFGGLMQHTGQMEVLVSPVVSKVRSFGVMNALTVVTCIFMNILLPDQYLGISIPGQMYGQEYEKRGISRADLGAALKGGGAVTSPLVPWNTCGIYCMTILGVSPMLYMRNAYLCLLLPVAVVLTGFLRRKGK